MKAPNGRLSDDSSAHARRHGGAFGGSYPKSFMPPTFCCAQIKLFYTYDENENLSSLKMYLLPKFWNWLWAWFCQNFVCN